MILHTGGSEFEATSTRSKSASLAKSRASFILNMPSCSPAEPITRTLGARICLFILRFKATSTLLKLVIADGEPKKNHKPPFPKKRDFSFWSKQSFAFAT
ncbi:Uncharacterised protein [Chlamydia trachomatis]|nr:Uncharacterised protein [Chlamydia trachomatis]